MLDLISKSLIVSKVKGHSSILKAKSTIVKLLVKINVVIYQEKTGREFRVWEILKFDAIYLKKLLNSF